MSVIQKQKNNVYYISVSGIPILSLKFPIIY